MTPARARPLRAGPPPAVVVRYVREHPECSLPDVQRWLRDRYAVAGPPARRAVRGLLRLGVLRSLGPRGAGYRLAVNDRGGAS